MGIHVYLPPYPTPLGCPKALALGALLHVSNFHWSSVLHMVMNMFQCYSLKSSHCLFLPQSTKTVLYISVSFAALHVGS